MGNSLNLINSKNFDLDINENDQLFIGLSENAGTRKEDEFFKKIIIYYIQNHSCLNSKSIELWWEKREKLFSNVDDLLWSHPLMLDDILNRSDNGMEEKRVLTMTSNMRIRILKYLEKLRCIMDDEFSLLNDFNWEEYIGLRLQCYIDLIFIWKKYRKNTQHFLSNLEDVEMGNLSLFDSLICSDKESKTKIHDIFRKNSGNMRIYEKIIEKSTFTPKDGVILKLKTNLSFRNNFCSSIIEEVSPRTKIRTIKIPKSLEDIYMKKENFLNKETSSLLEMLLEYINLYYKNYLISNGYFRKHISDIFQYKMKNETIDKNTTICISQIIQKILFNSIYEVVNNKSEYYFQVLEILISSILQLGIDILSIFSGGRTKETTNPNNKKETILRYNSQKLDIISSQKILEYLFSENEIFFGMVRTSLIIINILSSEINPKFNIFNFSNVENIQQNDYNFLDKENSIRNNLFLQDIHSISLIIRTINKCITLTRQINDIRNLIIRDDKNKHENYFDNLSREELYSYGPFQFNSTSKNNFIVEFQEQYKLIGVETEIPENQIQMDLYQDSEKVKYFWKLIQVHNTSHIIFIFADKCSTEKNRDIVEIFGLKKNRYFNINSDNLKYLKSYYTESLCGELSGDSSKWPKKPIIYEGNSLLLVFRISTKLEHRSTFNEQWGFRIYFKAHFWNQIVKDQKDTDEQEKVTNYTKFNESSYLYNLNDVLLFSTAAIASSISIMLRGPIVSQIEKSYVDILHSLLFTGGLCIEESDDEMNISKSVPFFWNNQDTLYNYMDLEFNVDSEMVSETKYILTHKHYKNIQFYSLENGKEVVLDQEKLYSTTPRIDQIEYQIIKNLEWGKIINFILERASIIHYNLKKNHSDASIELINDKKFLSIINHEIKTGRVGGEAVSLTIRGYICCYLHHLGLYYNIFQLCESLLKNNVNMLKTIIQINEEKSNNLEFVFNKNNEILKYIITFILNADFCESLLYVWTLGKQFRSWIIMERQKAYISFQESGMNNQDTYENKLKYDYWCRLLNSKIQLVLNIVPFSGNSHPEINSDINYDSFEQESFATSVIEEQKENDFDINGSKYIYYPNENICLVLSSIVNISNSRNNYLNINKSEAIENTNFYDEKNTCFYSEDQLNNSYLFNDDYECDELEILDINHIIKNICDGINDFMKARPINLDEKMTEISNNNDSDLSGMNFVLEIRRFRAIIRFEAYRILDYLVNSECENEFLQLLLIKSIRSLGNETPCQLPTDSANYFYEKDQENWIPCKPKYCLFLPHECFSLKKEKFCYEVHYTDNLRGCGKKIQFQVKKAYYKLVDTLTNESKPLSIESQILRISVLAFYMIKEADLMIILRSNIPTKILKLMTGCEKECEIEQDCIPTVFPGPYPIFLIYSIMSIKSSIWDNSVLRLSFIFSSFVGLSHSMNINGIFKGRLTSRELWRMCEIYFMGNILILCSRIENILADFLISRREQRMYIEYMKYIFNKRNKFKFSMKSSFEFDKLFVQVFLLQPSSISKVLSRTFNSHNPVLQQYSIKLLWKFSPLMTVENFLNLYSKKLLLYQLESNKEYQMDYSGFFSDCLEQIGRSFALFDKFNFNDQIKTLSPVILVDSPESGVLSFFKKHQGTYLETKNRILDNKENYCKNLIILLRYIVSYADKEYKKIETKKFQLENKQDLIYEGLTNIISQNINKIPELLKSLLNDNEEIVWKEIYRCIGSLTLIIDEYEDEVCIGNRIFYREIQLNNLENRQNWNEGILISSNPTTNQLNILVSEKDKSLELKTFNHNNLKICIKCQISFPIQFFVSKLKMDIILSLIKIADIANDYLIFLSPLVSSEESLLNHEGPYSTTISDQNKKKYIGLQFLSMSISLICMLLKNNYLSNLINDKNNFEIIKKLHKLMINIGMIKIPEINERIEDSTYLDMVILYRRFIQRIQDLDKFSSSKYYPIFKKSTQTDLLFSSPYSKSTVKLPTSWELEKRCSYYFDERIVICNLLPQFSSSNMPIFITANNCIPTTLCYYYFECKFINLKTSTSQIQKDLSNFDKTNQFAEFSIGIYREGCLRDGAGKFGSFAYKNTGKLIHSCTEEEIVKANVEKFTYEDIVGCGIDFIHNLVFFTKNGKLLMLESNHQPIEFELSNNMKFQEAFFEDVKGQFRPAIWIESFNLQPRLSYFSHILVEGNFGQEKFKYNYINRLKINNILSLIEEDESIVQNSVELDTISTFSSNNLNCVINKVEFNRRTLAGELHEIMGGGLFPMSLCILALERCDDNLEFAINWLLENGIQELDNMQTNFLKENSQETINSSQISDIIQKNISLIETIEHHHLLNKLVNSRVEIGNSINNEYFTLINADIYRSWNVEDPRITNKFTRNNCFDISRYLLSFGPFGESTWNGIEGNLRRSANSSNNNSSYSNDIWFYSSDTFQTNTINLQRRIENTILNHNTQNRPESSINSSNPNLKFNVYQKIYFPGTVVKIASNIKYWMSFMTKEHYFESMITSEKNINNIIDLHHLPRCKTIYFLRRLSKLTGVIWSCNQVSNSALVHFIDYNSLVYYFVDLPTYFLVEMKTNFKNNINIPKISGFSRNSSISFQQYIRDVFLSEAHNEAGQTNLNEYLTSVFKIYPQLEYLKCISEVRDAVSMIINQVPIYIYNTNEYYSDQTFIDTLRLFKLVFGNKGPTLCEYSLSNLFIMEKENLNSIFCDEEKKTNIQGFIETLEKISKNNSESSVQIIFDEYISHIKNSLSYKLPIIFVETSHPYESNIDKKIDISIQGCQYIYAVFDPLCEIQLDTLSSLTISIKNRNNGEDIIILKKTGKSLSGYKQVIPVNSFSIRLISSAHSSDKYGIKVVFIPIKYSLNDESILQNNNIHFSYILLDLLCRNIKNSKVNVFPKIREIVEMLLIIIYSIHIPKNMRYNIGNYSENKSTFSSSQENILPLQNIFIHIIQQLIYIFRKTPNILSFISEKSIVILEYLDNLSNIIYSLQMDQLQLVTNNGQNIDIKFCLLMQLHYLLFFYSNNKNSFLLTKIDDQEINQVISSNLFNSLTSLDLQVQLNLITELNLSVYDSLIKINHIYFKNKCSEKILIDENFDFKQNQSIAISHFLLSGDFRSHQLLVSSNSSLYNICSWFHIISTLNVSNQVFKSSLLNNYVENYDFSNGNLFIESFHELINEKINFRFPSWSINNQYSCIDEPNPPLIIIEKISEIQIYIISAKIILSDKEIDLEVSNNLSIDITEFIKETARRMNNKILILPKNRFFWTEDPFLKSCLNSFEENLENILNQPIIINYSLLRVLTNEIIVSKCAHFGSNDLIVITASPYFNKQDRVKLLWDLLLHLENSEKYELGDITFGRPWVNNWEHEMILSHKKKKDVFDPRYCIEYLDTFTFKLLGEGKICVPNSDSNEQNKEKTEESWEKTPTIQLMKDFLLKSYSSSIFERNYWPVFTGTIPICDVEFSLNSENSSKNYKNIELPSQVSTFREISAPCSISFWLYPLELNTWNQVFSISNNKKFEKLSYNINSSGNYSLNDVPLEIKYNSEENIVNNSWKLIAYRGITISTISFWITETGSLAVIINSPNKNYSSNLLMINQTIPQHSRDIGIASFSSFIQNNSSIIEYHTTKIISNRKIYQNQWNHIALTIGSSEDSKNSNTKKDEDEVFTVKLYINGLLDESKNIPVGTLPLLSGDLPWIIGWPKHMRDFTKNNLDLINDDNSLNQNKSNIFLGQDIASSKLLEFSGSNYKYSKLTTGEPLFGLIANLLVVYLEWDLNQVHNYIKETYDEIIYQDEMDELNASANLSEYSNNSNVYSDTSILTTVPKDNFYYSSCKSVVHVFSSNWKNKPIVTYFNNIWQNRVRGCRRIFDQKNNEKLSEKKLENIYINKIKVFNKKTKSFIYIDNKSFQISFSVNLNIIGYKEIDKFDENLETQDQTSENCSCNEYPIDMNIIIGNENSTETPFVILKLKYLNKLFNNSTLSKLIKVLDTFFEEECNLKRASEANSNININSSQIILDLFSCSDILKEFYDHGEVELCINSKIKNNSSNYKNIVSEFTDDAYQENGLGEEKTKTIIPYIKEFMEYLFSEIKNQDILFAIPINNKQSNSYYNKIGCENCENSVLAYCSICYSIIKKISLLFVSILNCVDIISPRSSIFKYVWLRRLKKYINLSFKNIILSLCLALTEDSAADGRIRVSINRPKSILYNRESQDIYDPYGLNSVFGQVFKNLENVPVSRIRTRNRPWYVIYEGEGGIDAGGIYRDSISHICFELQSDRLPLFILCPNSYGFGENQYYFIPNPNLAEYKYIYNFIDEIYQINQDINSNFCKHENNFKIKYSGKCSEAIYDSLYRFVGRLMGISIRTHLPLNLDFPKIIWKLILNEEVNLSDVKQIDGYSVRLYEKLVQIKSDWNLMNEIGIQDERMDLLLEEFDSLDLCWSLTNSSGKLIEIRENGKYLPVKITDLDLYCSFFISYKINFEFTHATKNIREGIIDIIPEQILELFTPSELEKLICGVPSIDVNLLKLHTKYTGYSSDDEIIQWFWDVLSEFSIIQQQMFLRFVWGRCRLPNSNSNWESNMEIVRLYPGRYSINSNNEASIEENNQIYEIITSETSERVNNSNSLEFTLEDVATNSVSRERIEHSLNSREFTDQNQEIEEMGSRNGLQMTENTSSSSSSYIRKEDLMLPTSHTCFFQLELPKYSSKEILKEKLLYAITEGIAIDTDNRASDINWDQN